MSDNAVLYTAVYNDIDAARADLNAFEQLHEAKLIGKYDAAIIDVEDGEPHIVKRADHPRFRVIPEWFGAGTLPRHDLHDAARELAPGEAALIAVGEPTLEKAWDEAVTRASRTVKRDLDATADELERQLAEAVQK
jgi:hypothetical protein